METITSLQKSDSLSNPLFTHQPARKRLSLDPATRSIYFLSSFDSKANNKTPNKSSIFLPKNAKFAKSVLFKPASTKNFSLSTPKKFDLLGNSSTKDKKLASDFISKHNTTDILRSTLSLDFMGKINKSIEMAEEERDDLIKIHFKKPYSHPKAKNFFKAVKENDFTAVKFLIGQFPELKQVVDSVIFK
jgi:hypothetical protein